MVDAACGCTWEERRGVWSYGKGDGDTGRNWGRCLSLALAGLRLIYVSSRRWKGSLASRLVGSKIGWLRVLPTKKHIQSFVRCNLFLLLY